MANRIQIRRDTAANWTSVNPVLAQGEVGLETDTGKMKVGDGGTAWNSLAYEFDATYPFRAVAPDPRVAGIVDRTPMASPPTVTNGATAPAGWTVRRVHTNTADADYWKGFRVSGGAHGTNLAPLPVVSGAPPQYSPAIEFDIDVQNSGDGFAVELNAATDSFIQVWANEQTVHTAPQQTSVLAGGTGDRRIIYAFTPGYYRIRIQTAFAPNDPTYIWSITTPPTLGVFAPIIRSRRVFIVGDSYSAAVGTTALTTNVPDYFKAYSMSLGLLLGIADVWEWASLPGTGFIGNGSAGTSSQTHLLKLQAIAPYVRAGDLIITQGSINDGGTVDQSAAMLTAITNYKSWAKANLPRVQMIYTSPLYIKNRTTSTDNAYTWTTSAYNTLGLKWVDVYGAAERAFSGTGNVGNRVVTDGATTNASTTVTSATANFLSGDVGSFITGSGIPANTTIASVTNNTTAVLSAAATATATAVSLTITNQKGDGNADFYAANESPNPSQHPSDAGHDALARALASRIAPLLQDNITMG